MDIFAEVTDEEQELIRKIAKRAWPMFESAGITKDQINIEMDLQAAHKDCPIDFKSLLEFPEFDFKHDIFGIHRNLNRKNGELRNCFCPRAALHDRTIFVKEIEVKDPETGAAVPIEIHKDTESGAMFGIDATFTVQVSEYVNSPFNDSKLKLTAPGKNLTEFREETVTGGNAGSHG